MSVDVCSSFPVVFLVMFSASGGQLSGQDAPGQHVYTHTHTLSVLTIAAKYIA